MSVPRAPVVRRDAVCDRNGILLSFIMPGSEPVTTHTVSWKAESWWQSASATFPGGLTEFLIQDVPPNEKVSVWVFSTNEFGSSQWSDPIEFISSRDCGQAGEAAPDISKEVPVSAKLLYDLLYTRELDAFNAEKGLVSSVEVLQFDDLPDKVFKRARVTPPIPESLRTAAASYMGPTILTYDEVSVKHKDKYQIDFRIENVPIVGHFADTCEGKFTVVEVSENRCRFEGYFDLRINYPVIGYYIAQVIRNQAIRDLSKCPDLVVEILQRKGLVPADAQ
eukprot:c4257_g1_i1.p1 GENE.c4257_g1_i1~~c4257_g1_i1.p1  ORF type:complete len:301 (+),score=64.45 c4257_g1_i1:69-905(+)